MRTAFIIIAIFAAVVLLVRFAAPHAKPKFYRGERVTQSVLINNIRALGKKCAVTENGLGISQSINIKHVIDECKNRVISNTADDWQKIIYGASGAVLRALSNGKKSAAYSLYCAHVGKYPRVYLFCEMLVRQSDCSLSRDLILNSISAFEESAPFTQSERKILCGMLRFCLIGHLFSVAEVGLKRAEMYDKGTNDGKNGKVDLTYIRVDDYICGLTDGCVDSERSAVIGLFEYNVVDVTAAEKSRRKFSAQTYVTVNSVLLSLSAADECEREIYYHTKRGESVKRYVKVFNIMFPILLVVYAVFTCVFASPKYVALFSVAAILTYGVMRIPVLLYSPNGGINIFAPIERLLNGFVNRNKSESILDSDKQFMSETAYFGCEPQYMERTIEGGLNVACDNRGGIAIDSGKNIDRLYIGIKSDGEAASLTECDGAIEHGRVTYRVCKNDIELCAEVLVPIDIAACIVKLTVINRSPADRTVNLTSAVVRSAAEDCITEDICNGAMANCGDGFALSVASGKYGGDLSAFCADGTLRHGRTNKPAVIGSSDVNVNSFSRVCSFVIVVYAKSRTEAESMLRYVSDELFYSRAAVGSAVYCRLNKQQILPVACDMRIAARRQTQVAEYPPPKLQKRELMYNLPFGGIAEDGSTVITDSTYYSPIENTVASGKLGLSLNQFGIQEIIVCGKSVTPLRDMYLHMPNAFVVIGENGLLWSPTTKPCEGGETFAVHGRGYTEYTCAYNGTMCTQKCFTVKSAVYIEVALHNKTSEERNFDIMFSALCKSGACVELTDSGVVSGNLLFCALGESAEYALYKEAYYIYGRVARASNFRSGGSTPAPTVSVNKSVKPNTSVKVVFCIDGMRDTSSVNAVDDLFDNAKCFYDGLGRISPKTDDGVLNISYIQALYGAYAAFISRRSMPLRELSFVMSAVKYVEPATVKYRMYEVLSCQSSNGELGGYTDCLQFLCCVSDYLQFTQDCEFGNDILPYAAQPGRAAIKDTANNHVLRAVEYIIVNTAPKSSSLVQSIWNNKNLINVLRFWEDRIKDGKLRAACKKRFNAAAEEYSGQVKRLVSNNFFEFGSVAEAYMCAKLLFDLDLNEKAYNIIKYNNPIERCLHYGNREQCGFDYFGDPVSSAVYFTTVTERLFGVKFRGKTVKICPHTSCVTPKTAFDIHGKTNDVRITVDDSNTCGNWKMRVNKINYPADSVNLSELSDDIVFYRDGKE